MSSETTDGPEIEWRARDLVRRTTEVRIAEWLLDNARLPEWTGMKLPTFSISKWRDRWWLDRDCPENGFTAQVVGPFKSYSDAAKQRDWINRRNRREEAMVNGLGL